MLLRNKVAKELQKLASSEVNCQTFTAAVDKDEDGNKGFKQLAQAFNQSAQNVKVNDGTVEPALKHFRSAASNFQQAGNDLSAFANQLQTSITTCSQITALAPKFASVIQKFKSNAGSFRYYAGLFQSRASDVSDKWKFKNAAYYFKWASHYFKTLADGLAEDLTGVDGLDELKSQAGTFKTNTELFHTEAQAFDNEANKVTGTDNAQLTGIQAAFLGAFYNYSLTPNLPLLLYIATIGNVGSKSR